MIGNQTIHIDIDLACDITNSKKFVPIRMETVKALSLSDEEDLSARLRNEALAALEKEPELSTLLNKTVLAPDVKCIEDAVAITVSCRLMSGSDCSSCLFSVDTLRDIIKWAFEEESMLELGYSMKQAVREDLLAVYNRDPACKTILEIVLFFKGFAALVCHRAARRRLLRDEAETSMVALFLQSQASAVFGVDIHPGATIGSGVLLDHGTGIVIGETAVIGNGCTLLHGVTLGGTGKDTGDRHPKVGENVLVGANCSILGNIRIGHGAKIGAGSIVLRPLPSGCTAVGAPARIIGRAKESNPAAGGDLALQGVDLFHLEKKPKTAESKSTEETMSTLSSDDESNVDDFDVDLCPFRDLRRFGRRNHTRDSVTFDQMERLLKAEGATTSEIGETFFEMDQDCDGRVRLEDFEERGASVLRRHSAITQEHANAVVQKQVAKNRMKKLIKPLTRFRNSFERSNSGRQRRKQSSGDSS